EREIGDVLIAWENEALLSQEKLGADKFEIVVPSVTILAEPPVAVVDKNAEKNKTTEVAKAYLQYLYSDEGQEIVARHHFRPRSEKVAAAHAAEFPQVRMLSIDDLGGWAAAQKVHFDDGGIFDQIYQPGN